MPSLSISTILQIVVGLGLLNVWLMRARSPTSYRGGDSKSLKEEIAAYGLPDAGTKTAQGAITEDQWNATIDVNLKSCFNYIQAVVPAMEERSFGRIVSMSSLNAYSGGVTAAVSKFSYAAAKAGIIGFSKSLAREIGSRGITVNAVAPGFIDTDMTRGLPAEQREALIAERLEGIRVVNMNTKGRMEFHWITDIEIWSANGLIVEHVVTEGDRRRGMFKSALELDEAGRVRVDEHGMTLIADHRPVDRHESIGWVTPGPGGRLAYAASDGGPWFVVVDGRGFRNWFKVESRVSDQLLFQLKVTRDHNLPRTYLDVRQYGEAYGDDIESSYAPRDYTSFRLQMDYTF